MNNVDMVRSSDAQLQLKLLNLLIPQPTIVFSYILRVSRTGRCYYCEYGKGDASQKKILDFSRLDLIKTLTDVKVLLLMIATVMNDRFSRILTSI